MVQKKNISILLICPFFKNFFLLKWSGIKNKIFRWLKIMEKEKMMYGSLSERIRAEYKIFILALIFVAVADSIGRVSIPLKIGTFILFPIFYSLILGMTTGPQCFKILKTAVGKIQFTAPLTMVGAFAGISMSNQLKSFAGQGWKMIIISILVMTETFLGSAIISQIVLALTGVI